MDDAVQLRRDRESCAEPMLLRPAAPREPPSRLAFFGSALFVGAFIALAVLEERYPLRARTQPKLGRDLRNLAMAGLSALTINVLEKPVVQPLARSVERRGWGLLKVRRLPPWLEALLAIALMDYTLYLWHVLLHRWPALWRLHRPHHVDLDMDASTGVRFHFAEMAASAPWRAAQVALLGIGPRSLSIWRGFVLGSILFHHSNLRLPRRFEAALAKLVVTPRLHGIHHSVVEREQRTNFSSGLTIWDRLHGTFNLDIGRDEVELGVTGCREPEVVRLPRVLAMPFQPRSRDCGVTG